MENTKQVLACIDGSRYSDAICDYAAWISQSLGAPLKLLHNLEHSANAATADLTGAIGLGSQEALLEELTELEAKRNRLLLEQGKQMLEVARKRVVAAGVEFPILKQRHDGLTESLIACEDEIRVLVLGIRGEEHAQDELHLGSHLESSIRALHKPILVVNGDFKQPEQVMLAYDGSEASSKALAMLADSPLFKSIPVHLVSVGEQTRNTGLFQAAADKLSNGGHDVTTATLDGDTSASLHDYQDQHNIDLTLMGAFSHTRLREWVLGSLTVKMLLSSSRPLLLLR